MAKHREIARLWVASVLSGWVLVLNLLGIVVLLVGGLRGPQPETQFAAILAALDPYRWYVALALFVGAAYVTTYKVVNRIERDFYANNLNARADRAHRVFRRLLNESHNLWIAPREDLPEILHQWDVKVRQALREHCLFVRDDMYYTHTRREGPDHGDFRIPVDGLGPAQEHLWRLLEDLEQEPSRWLKPNS